MNTASRVAIAATAIVAAITTTVAARADGTAPFDRDNSFKVNPLTSNQKGIAPNTDSLLQNAWGITFSPAASPFWVSDNATGCSTLYDGGGVPQPPANPLKVAIPLPGNVIPPTACMPNDPKHPLNPTPAAPTGVVWNPTINPTTAFLVPGTTTPAIFIFDTEDGTISAWAGGSAATIAVDVPKSGPPPVYKGLVFGTNSNGVMLFATNFRAGTVDVFDHNYQRVTTKGGFADPDIPAGFAPFGIQNIDGVLFVTFAKQDAAKHDDVAGPGKGFVDVFDTDGNLLKRFAARGTLNSPWGVSRAPYDFGQFSGDILVGNFGNG